MNQTLEQVRKELDRELDLGLALSKAEGNLNFLAEISTRELARFNPKVR